MERGVVFSACELFKIENGTGFRTGRWITPVEINYLSLYWDKLVSPTNNILNAGLQNEEELIKCGLLTRPVYKRYGLIRGDDMAEFYAETHAKTIDILRHNEGNVDWRMYFLNDQINIQPELSRQAEVIRFEIFNLLPVPNVDVNLQEILEFKERRKPELVALHAYLDELYLDIKNSGDLNLQRAKALSGLKKAIMDLDTLNHETWRSPIKFNITTSFEFDFSQAYGAIFGGIAAFAAPPPYDLLGGLGSVVSVLGGCIKINPQLQSVLVSGNKNLSYISKGKQENLF
jgi:hypothetical protein